MKGLWLVAVLAVAAVAWGENKHRACYQDCEATVASCEKSCSKLGKARGGNVKFCQEQCKKYLKTCEKDCDNAPKR